MWQKEEQGEEEMARLTVSLCVCARTMITYPLPSASSIRAKWNADAGARTPALGSDAEC